MAINNIAVIGSGLMGHGIAQVAAMSGQDVILIDIKNEFLDRAMQRIENSLDVLSRKDKLKENPESIKKRIRTTVDLKKGVGNADYVIEAVPENIDLKQNILCDVDAHAPSHAIIATNTSGLSISAIAEATKREEKVIGTHWMNPPQLMKLVEVINGKYTNDETFQTTIALLGAYNKEIVVAKKDVWLFLAARSRLGYSLETNLMYLQKGATHLELDAVARYKLGLKMGEFELMDFAGSVDIKPQGLNSTETILKTRPDFEPWSVLLELNRHLAKEFWLPMAEKGLKGVKDSKGFYDHPDFRFKKPEIQRELAECLDPLELLAPGLNTSAWCVTNGVGSIEDVNKSFRLAFNWPKGIFDYLDDYGIDDVKAMLKKKMENAPQWLQSYYEIDPLLENWKMSR